MSAKLSDADLALMARDWWAQHDKPLEPIYSFPRPLVPFNELPEAGAGAIVAEAIRFELAENGYQEGVNFVGSRWGWGTCLACGSRRPDVLDRGGWCGRCEGGEDR